MPKVSVIIPVYNVEKYLKECLDSVISQTLQDIEIIIVNNGASLNEGNIINEYASNNSKIKIIKFTKNQGYGKAINTALLQATGEYIGIVDSDDFIANEMFLKLYEKAKKYNADIIKSSYIAIDEYKNNYRTENFQNKIPKDKKLSIDEIAIFFEFHPSIWSCLYKREFLINKNLKFTEIEGAKWVDNPFQVETFIHCDNFIYTSDSYYYYREKREESSSSLNEGVCVPAIASNLVHEILNKYHINNTNICKSLAIRENAYIRMIKHKLLINNYKNATKSINRLFELIGTSLDNDTNYRKIKQRLYKKPLWHIAIYHSITRFLNTAYNKEKCL